MSRLQYVAHPMSLIIVPVQVLKQFVQDATLEEIQR